MNTCGFCRKLFGLEASKKACGACPSSCKSNFLKCPHCGFENPKQIHFLRDMQNLLKKWFPVVFVTFWGGKKNG